MRVLAGLALGFLFACGGAGGVPDPRPALLPVLPDRGPEGIPVEDALRTEQHAAACTGALARVHAPGADDAPWVLLLRAAARTPPAGCLERAQGDALVAWAMDPAGTTPGDDARRAAWRGAAAEWVAANGDVARAQAWLALPGEDSARLRVALAARDSAAATDAAEGALLLDPREVLACRLVAGDALARGDVLGALEAARCGGTDASGSPLLARLRADALARAGLWADAAAAYEATGARVHAAAILYQSLGAAGRARAASLLDGPGPAEALHLGWLALLEGRAPPSDLLARAGATPPAAHLRAIADPYRVSPEDLALLERADHARAKVALARVRAARGDAAGAETALAAARAHAPASEPVYRAWVALRAQLGGDVEDALAAWAALDPDHVRLSGVHDDREVPWAVVAPWTWAAACGARARDRRCAADAPRGADDVGTAWRAAAAVPAGERLDALAALQARSPTLHGLATERWRLAAPDPERPLDVPRSVE